MKKLILMTGLMIISLQAKLYAQSTVERLMSMSKTEQTFDNKMFFWGIRDFVTLREGKMILEVPGINDYAAFKELDSILIQFLKEVSFYRDSFAANPTAHYRIDYVLNDQYTFKKIRFKKYNADGDIYMNREGEVAKLKFEQDTVNIILQRTAPGITSGKNGLCKINYSAKATFLLANYTDISKIVAAKELAKIIDTLDKVSQSHQKKSKKYGWLHDPLTIVYNPYYGNGRMNVHKGLRRSEWATEPIPDKITFNPRMGIGMVRNTLTPVIDLGIQLNTSYWNDFKNYTYIRVSATGNYFFDRTPDGKHLINDNWFINAAIGNMDGTHQPGWPGLAVDFGIGYLVSPKGGYFKNSTFRVFTDLVFVKGLTITPELIATNNFKQIFPGITVTFGH